MMLWLILIGILALLYLVEKLILKVYELIGHFKSLCQHLVDLANEYEKLINEIMNIGKEKDIG